MSHRVRNKDNRCVAKIPSGARCKNPVSNEYRKQHLCFMHGQQGVAGQASQPKQVKPRSSSGRGKGLFAQDQPAKPKSEGKRGPQGGTVEQQVEELKRNEESARIWYKGKLKDRNKEIAELKAQLAEARRVNPRSSECKDLQDKIKQLELQIELEQIDLNNSRSDKNRFEQEASKCKEHRDILRNTIIDQEEKIRELLDKLDNERIVSGNGSGGCQRIEAELEQVSQERTQALAAAQEWERKFNNALQKSNENFDHGREAETRAKNAEAMIGVRNDRIMDLESDVNTYTKRIEDLQQQVEELKRDPDEFTPDEYEADIKELAIQLDAAQRALKEARRQGGNSAQFQEEVDRIRSEYKQTAEELDAKTAALAAEIKISSENWDKLQQCQSTSADLKGRIEELESQLKNSGLQGSGEVARLRAELETANQAIAQDKEERRLRGLKQVERQKEIMDARARIAELEVQLMRAQPGGGGPQPRQDNTSPDRGRGNGSNRNPVQQPSKIPVPKPIQQPVPVQPKKESKQQESPSMPSPPGARERKETRATDVRSILNKAKVKKQQANVPFVDDAVPILTRMLQNGYASEAKELKKLVTNHKVVTNWKLDGPVAESGFEKLWIVIHDKLKIPGCPDDVTSMYSSLQALR